MTHMVTTVNAVRNTKNKVKLSNAKKNIYLLKNFKLTYLIYSEFGGGKNSPYMKK